MHIDHTSLFAALSNETRLRCLYLAARHREVCVCEVVDTLKIAQPTASKAFKALKNVGLVCDRRDANWIYYRLNDAMPGWMRAIVKATINDLSRSHPYVSDERRFERSRIREQAVC